MKRLYMFTICLMAIIFSSIEVEVKAEDMFPEFKRESIRTYIPIEEINFSFQEDLEHEVGFNFSYNINGQLFIVPSKGHIQTLTEGFSGVTDKSTPWKTLTELLAAYKNSDLDAVRDLYSDESQTVITEWLSEPEVKERFMNFMKSASGMEVLLGFDHKQGFLALVNVDYGIGDPIFDKDVTPFFFVQSGTEFLLSATTLDEPIDTNISMYLQTGLSVADLVASKHGLSIEKIGNGYGIVRGSGIDCGEDCLEVYVEGTAVWLQATSDEFSTFEGWLVDDEPLKGQLSMKEDTIVTAVFEKIPPKEYALGIEKSGTGEGRVSDSETVCETADCLEFSTLYAGETESQLVKSGIDCGETCSGTYIEGTTLRLKAVATEGSEFVEWLVNGEPLVADPAITDNVTITAVFEEIVSPEEEPTDEEEQVIEQTTETP